MLTILVVTGLLAICFLGLGFNIFFRKNGKFPETEIERNREMRRRGIHCVKHEEISRYKRARKLKQLNDCCGCSSGLCEDHIRE